MLAVSVGNIISDIAEMFLEFVLPVVKMLDLEIISWETIIMPGKFLGSTLSYCDNIIQMFWHERYQLFAFEGDIPTCSAIHFWIAWRQSVWFDYACWDMSGQPF